MGPLFRIYMGGVYLSDEPKNLTETELTIARDEKQKGVVISFTSEVTFYGDGYVQLRSIRDAGSGCAQVPVNIEFHCAETRGWEVLYSGVIPLGSEDVEWDDYNCTVTTRIENADFSTLLENYADNRVIINTDFCADGNTSLAPITKNATDFFASFSGVFTGIPVGTFLFTDVLQQALSYISNNQITLVPDPLYSTLYLAQILDLDFIDPLAPGDIITLEFTNYYGQNYTVTHTCTGVSDIAAFARQCLHFGDSSVSPDLDRTNFFEKASSADLTLGPDITLINFLPWDNITFEVNGGAKDTSITESQSFQYGLKNLGITSSTVLQQQKADISYSLNQLLNHATELHNMGWQITINPSGGYFFNLTHLPDMLVNTSNAVALPQVSGLITKTSGTYNVNSLTTPKGDADNIFKSFTWNSVNCYGENKKLESEKCSTQEFFDLFTSTQVQDDELYYVFLKDGDYTEAEGFRVIVSSTVFAAADQFHYNIPYMMALVAKQSQIYAADNDLFGSVPLSPFDLDSTCPNCPTARIENTNTVFLRNVTTFQHPVSYSQVRNLLDNALQYVNFSDGRNVAKKGFIKQVKIPFKTFLASFDLYTD
jgi:hypothetical protein